MSMRNNNQNLVSLTYTCDACGVKVNSITTTDDIKIPAGWERKFNSVLNTKDTHFCTECVRNKGLTDEKLRACVVGALSRNGYLAKALTSLLSELNARCKKNPNFFKTDQAKENK